MTTPNAMPTELVAAIRRSDAILYMVARPDPDGRPGLMVDWGTDGIPKRYAALLLRDLADEWDRDADADGEPPIDAGIHTMSLPTHSTDTTKEING